MGRGYGDAVKICIRSPCHPPGKAMSDNLNSLADALKRVVDDQGGEVQSDEVVVRDASSQQLLDAVKQGYRPVVYNPPITLGPGEVAHFAFSGIAAFQVQKVGTRVVGRSSGITIYDHGLGVTFGKSEGVVQDVHADVRLGTGSLILKSAAGLRISIMGDSLPLDADFVRCLRLERSDDSSFRRGMRSASAAEMQSWSHGAFRHAASDKGRYSRVLRNRVAPAPHIPA